VIATFELTANIDVLGNPRITLGKGKHRITDPRVIRILRGSGRPGGEYPGCRLISMESETPTPCAGGEVAGTHSPTGPEVQIKTNVGLQFKPPRERGGRIADVVDRDE
jgi:hypothetical protein